MEINIYRVTDQGTGSFDGGKIKEYKPIGFPTEGSKLKPYSNLFYWAFAWSDNGGLIGEHPHKGFEIMSFVVRGEINHYDNQLKDWLVLKEGDAQVIRSGNGITHAERILQDSAMFQIWLDPNLAVTLNKNASYNDYKNDFFAINKFENYSEKIYCNSQSGMQLDAEGIEIKEYFIDNGIIKLELQFNFTYNFYVKSGTIQIKGDKLTRNDFFTVSATTELIINSNGRANLFVLRVPNNVSYPTYANGKV